MELLPKLLRDTLPPLYATEEIEDPIVHCKFFNPTGSGTWLILEFDGKDTLFGFTHILEGELGYSSLSELQSFKGSFHLGIERDLYFQPQRLSQAKQALGLK